VDVLDQMRKRLKKEWRELLIDGGVYRVMVIRILIDTGGV
jgi:glycerol kinase